MAPELWKFLSSLNPNGAPTGSWQLPLATRAQDRARAEAKKKGYAIFDRKVWAWKILPAGVELVKGPNE